MDSPHIHTNFDPLLNGLPSARKGCSVKNISCLAPLGPLLWVIEHEHARTSRLTFAPAAIRAATAVRLREPEAWCRACFQVLSCRMAENSGGLIHAIKPFTASDSLLSSMY